MALLKIARMGHPVLRGRAAEIDDPTAPWVRRLVEDMIETMEDAGGPGIAAPPLHLSNRVDVVRVIVGRVSAVQAVSRQLQTVPVNTIIATGSDERSPR